MDARRHFDVDTFYILLSVYVMGRSNTWVPLGDVFFQKFPKTLHLFLLPSLFRDAAETSQEGYSFLCSQLFFGTRRDLEAVCDFQVFEFALEPVTRQNLLRRKTWKQ